MESARQMQEKTLVERIAEHAALRFVRGANNLQCAILNEIPIKCTVLDRQGNTIELHFSNICHEKPWKKYLGQNPDTQTGVLTNNAGFIAYDMAKWFLRGGYSKQYTYIKSKRARNLLRGACRIMVISHIMRQKYVEHGFLDRWAENEMGKILDAQAYAKEMHKATSHALKHGEDLAEAQETIYRRYLSIIEGREVIAYEAPPLLPAGTPDPLYMPDDEKLEEDTENDEEEIGGVA